MRELLEVCVITKRALETVGEETREISRGKCVAYVISGHSASLLLFPFVFPGSLPNHVLTHLTPQGHWLTIRSWSYILNAPLIRRSGLQETESSLSLLFVLGLPFSHLHQSSSLSPSVNSCTEALCPEHLHVSSRSEQWVSLVSSFFSLGALPGLLSSGCSALLPLCNSQWCQESQEAETDSGQGTENATVWEPKRHWPGKRESPRLCL